MFNNRKHIDDIFKDGLKNYSDAPSGEPWSKIKESLPQQEPKSYINWLAGGLAAVLMLLGGYFMMPVTQDQGAHAVAQLSEPAEEIPAKPEKAAQATSSAPSIPDKKKNADVAAEMPAAPSKAIVLSAAQPELKAVETEFIPPANISPVRELPLEKNHLNQPLILAKKSTNVITDEKERNEFMKLKGLHFAPIVRFNSTWIFNQNTYGIFDGYELAYTPTFGASYGFAAGYDFSSRYGVQAELVFSSQGQKYKDIIGSKWIERSVDLQYTHLPLLFKYKLSRLSSITKAAIVQNYVAGVQYGFLNSAISQIDGTPENITDRFRRSEWSLVFGMEYDFYLSEHFFLTLGGRGSISSDINQPEWRVKDNYGKSHNFLIGAHAGLNYFISE